jgi:hypothetical protein
MFASASRTVEDVIATIHPAEYNAAMAAQQGAAARSIIGLNAANKLQYFGAIYENGAGGFDASPAFPNPLEIDLKENVLAATIRAIEYTITQLTNDVNIDSIFRGNLLDIFGPGNSAAANAIWAPYVST